MFLDTTAVDSLDRIKQRLVNERNDKSNAKEKSIQVLNDALANKDIWDIEAISEKVYNATGYGLGYGEQLAMGSWHYYEDTASLEPIDSASMRLRDILTASNE
jgi:3-dehydroquinate dehydratase